LYVTSQPEHDSMLHKDRRLKEYMGATEVALSSAHAGAAPPN